MTTRARVSLTSGADFWHTQAPQGAGLPAITLADGPHGVRKQLTESGYSPESVPATCFPTASALAATWDVELLVEVGTALGAEARTEDVSVLLGPGANIKRSALCGRNFEYFSEDPFLSSRMAAAWIRGVQSTGVGASLKHFAVNNQEFRRYSIDALVDDRALREIYLASFEHAVAQAEPATVMAAYNRVNGTHCAENHELLTRILRDEWGFDGLVVSDWGAVTRRSACLAAGLDLEMPGYDGRGDDAVLAAVESGELSAAAVERAADAVTRVIERTAGARSAEKGYDVAAHHTLARRAAEAGTVLLKNDGGVLPLAPSTRVAVIGEFAKQPRYQGAGSSGINPHRLDDAWTDLSERVGSDRLTYAPGYRRGSGQTDSALIDEAVAAARGADVAVVFAGLPDSYETEGVDRANLSLPSGHDTLIAAVTKVCPRVVVVLAGGAPVTIPWHDDVPAIVECYLGGQAAGSAISRILTGDAEPGGRLAETFPLRTADNPVHVWPAGPSALEYRESIYVGYRYYDAAGLDVRYPFGHGLSYTTFVWTELEIAEVENDDASEQRFDVSVRITNTGDRPGSEVVQVYVRDVESTVFRPEQELAGFAKLFLVAGESRRVTVQVDRRAFAFWDTTIDDWSIESGDFEIRVGASSRDVRLSATVRLESDRSGFDPGPAAYHGSPVFERDAFAALYGRPLPDNVVDAPGHYTVDTPIADIRHPAATLLTTFMRRKVAAMAPTLDEDDPLTLLFERSLQELPPRMMPMLTQGGVTPDAVQSFVDICNGHGVRGVRALVASLRRR
ncbi:beta-glucosidase [Rhodococcus sp. LBL1]|nr:beta-glucosidase [Rhodococcus sp. LBL1]MDH6681702.1 beta-glucosidase [Rhodococcus sp. LBL2]